MAIELSVPKVGESITEVEIGEWLKSEGDTVALDETLVLLDSDKTTVELPSPVAGVLGRIVKNTGEMAQVGEVIAHLEEGGAAKTASTRAGKSAPDSTPQNASADTQSAQSDAEKMPLEAREQTSREADATAMQPGAQVAQRLGAADSQGAADAKSADNAASANGESGFVMPSAARVLAENGAASQSVSGSGPGGRVLKEDAQNFVAQSKNATPNGAATREGAIEPAAISQPAPSQPDGKAAQTTPQNVASKSAAPSASTRSAEESAANEEVVPMNMLRRRIASRLVEAQQTAALLTTFNEIDMLAVMELRKENQELFTKKHGIKLGFMSFFVKAAIDALKMYPAINAEIRESSIVYKNHYDIGVAIGGGKGLVVPVIRGVERLSFAEIEKSIADFAVRAKDGKLSPDELQGGTFTITNGGIYGSLMSTPIINPPQSGILGMHATQERPVARNGQVVIRPMMYIALTYDHRVIDGREAVSFLVRIKECIENPARMLIEA